LGVEIYQKYLSAIISGDVSGAFTVIIASMAVLAVTSGAAFGLFAAAAVWLFRERDISYV
jgi:membrane associated rhomboid family serine protease